MKTCPVVLEPPHPRAGQPCGARCLREACERHRPKNLQRARPVRDDDVRAREARRRRKKRAAGTLSGWEGM